jgi:hypothetical protein
MKRKIGIAAAALFAMAVLPLALWAQVPGLFISSPTGLEQVNVLVPSTGTIVTNPQIQTVTINQIRNSQGFTAIAAGTTVSTTVTNTASILIATGAITTWNVTLPVAPANGQVLTIGCPGGNVTTLTIAATLPSGVAITGTNPTSCTAATPTSSTFVYSSSANAWYRVI